jgi:hypothetical protein
VSKKPFPDPKDFIGSKATLLDDQPGSPVVITSKDGSQIILNQSDFEELRKAPHE